MKLVGRNFFDPSQASMLQHYRWVLDTFFWGFYAHLGTSLPLERNTTVDTALRSILGSGLGEFFFWGLTPVHTALQTALLRQHVAGKPGAFSGQL